MIYHILFLAVSFIRNSSIVSSTRLKFEQQKNTILCGAVAVANMCNCVYIYCTLIEAIARAMRTNKMFWKMPSPYLRNEFLIIILHTHKRRSHPRFRKTNFGIKFFMCVCVMRLSVYDVRRFFTNATSISLHSVQFEFSIQPLLCFAKSPREKMFRKQQPKK